jgi:hypothetical protein
MVFRLAYQHDLTQICSFKPPNEREQKLTRTWISSLVQGPVTNAHGMQSECKAVSTLCGTSHTKKTLSCIEQLREHNTTPIK